MNPKQMKYSIPAIILLAWISSTFSDERPSTNVSVLPGDADSSLTIRFFDDEAAAFNEDDIQLITGIIARAEKEVRAILPSLPDSIEVTVAVIDRNIDGVGCVTGRADAPGKVRFELSSTCPGGIRAAAQKALAANVFHEFHHLYRGWTIENNGFGPGIPVAAVNEGLADVFSETYTGVFFPEANSYPENADMWLAEIMALPLNADYGTWMFAHPDGRDSIGYRVGRFIVHQAIENSGKDILELSTLAPEEIIALVDTSASSADPMAIRISKQQKAPDRHQWDFRRDPARRPYEVFRYLGIEEGMTALDVGAYAGYTTEMLSAAVGPQGKVYAHNTEEVLRTYADGYYDRTMAERLANDRLPNVVPHLREYDDVGLDDEVDVAFLGNLLHDFYYRDGEENALGFLSSIHKSLKPGGVLGVMDHVGIDGADNKTLHRMTPQLARELLTRSGFEIEAESDMFANSGDDHSLMVYNDEIYLRTDRFLFRARKPE